MENNRNLFMLEKEKLGFFGILKESIKIPYRNPKFIVLNFVTSFPHIFLMVLYEIIQHRALIDIRTRITPPPPLLDPYTDYDIHQNDRVESFETLIRLFQDMSSTPKVLQLGLLYFGPTLLVELINTITTIISASAIYAEEKPINIKEMLRRLFQKKWFKGPLITYTYVLFLNSFVLCGMLWAVINTTIPSYNTFFEVSYGISATVLLLKWMEWSALWNMSIVFSVLEERHGLVAFWVSGDFSRGSKRRGLYLMSIFFVWRTVVRLTYFSLGGHETWCAVVTSSVLFCAGNVMQWVVCMVYFYDCKKRVLEKKVDVEEGRKINSIVIASA